MPTISIGAPRPETPHERALHDVGEKLLLGSVEVGREFCKFMVGICAGAVPTYLALVGLAVGQDFKPEFLEGAILLIAPFLFLAAGALFAAGYYPVRTQFSLDRPDEVETALAKITRRRFRLSRAAFVVFLIGSVAGIGGALYAIKLETASHGSNQQEVASRLELSLTKADRETLATLGKALRASANPKDREEGRAIDSFLSGVPGAAATFAGIALDRADPLEKAVGGILDAALRGGISGTINNTTNIAEQQNIAHQQTIQQQKIEHEQRVERQENVALEQRVEHQENIAHQQAIQHQQNIAHQQNSTGGLQITVEGGCGRRYRKYCSGKVHQQRMLPDTR
jgi:hypothetical protein